MAIKRRYIIIPLTALAVLAAVVIAVFYFIYFRGLSYDGIVGGQVAAGVEITRDDNGAPQIKAASPEDAFYALGYCHAQDRYNIMEYYRALAMGKSAPLVGDDGVTLDRLTIIIGFSRKAGEIKQALAEPYRGYLDHYARGVNAARKETLKGNLNADEWSDTDVIAILLLKEWANAFLNNSELLFALPESARSEELSKIFPENIPRYYEAKDKDSARIIENIGDLVRTYMGSFNRGMAFFVPAKDSQTDEYITGLTVDGEISQYPGWYPATIVLKDATVKGITFVGMPFIFSGANQYFSFCGFSLNIDTQDFCIEEVRKLKDVVQYLSAAGWRNFEPVTVPADAASGRDRLAAVWSTGNGPVLNDVFADKSYQADVVTLKAVYPGPDYVKSLFAVPFSKSAEEAAFSLQNVNSLPMVHLLNTNDQSLTVFSGKVPLRPAGDGVFRKGSDIIWNGLADLSAARTRTVFSSIVHSADPRGLPPAVQAYCIVDSGRAERLGKLLENRPKMSIRDVEAVLSDTRSITAEKFVPEFSGILKDNPVTSSRLARIYFQEWDFGMDSNKVAPLLFEAIMQQFLYETIADEIPEKIDTVMRNYHLLSPSFYDVMKENTSKIFDDVTTLETEETMESTFDKAFLKALRRLGRSRGPYIEDWAWGALHRGRLAFPYEDVNLIERFLFGVEDAPFDGGNSTVLYGSADREFRPAGFTALVGIFNGSISRINMHFAYSTNPMSRFYYGRQEGVLSFDLAFQNSEHKLTVLPRK